MLRKKLTVARILVINYYYHTVVRVVGLVGDDACEAPKVTKSNDFGFTTIVVNAPDPCTFLEIHLTDRLNSD